MLDQMNLVIVGHVDHGKSTLLGRLLADTGTLPKGKLEQVRAMCAANSRPFEYAFLLDALKDEQAQGITIDVARSFFKTKKRRYIIIDAPGHIEFLKNMVTGAARAEAAILLIDAKEGVKENSRRHGYILSMLGIKQVVVVVNKMDLVNYDESVFESIKSEYTRFLDQINVKPKTFVPIAARDGVNLAQLNPDKTPWYTGESVLDLIDSFEHLAKKSEAVFRFPVQDIYKFTEHHDDRRIVAGTISTGRISVGDDVVFYPSFKKSKISSIEQFNVSTQTQAEAGQAVGFTLGTQIYIKPGELMLKASDEPPACATQFKANIFWLGKKPMVQKKRYKLKMGTAMVPVYLKRIHSVIDASDLSTENNKPEIERHDVAECTFESVKPIAFDPVSVLEDTGRFVIIDDFEISGGGIVLEAINEGESYFDDYVKNREYAWVKGFISPEDRAKRVGQKPTFILLTGANNVGKQELAKALEKRLFDRGNLVYYLGISNLLSGIGADSSIEDRDEHIRRLGETAFLFMRAGMIFVSTLSDLTDMEARMLSRLIDSFQMMVIQIGELSEFSEVQPQLAISAAPDTGVGVDKIMRAFEASQIIGSDYSI